MTDAWPLQVDGRAYQRVPTSWIDHGVDADAPDGPQLLAVSAAPLGDALRVRYAHPRYDVVGAMRVAATDGQNGLIPERLPEGTWPRSIGAAALEPADICRQPERAHLDTLWRARAADESVDAPATGELRSDGAGDEPTITRACEHCGATIDCEAPADADHDPDCPLADRYGGDDGDA